MRLTVGSIIAIFRDQLQLGRYRHQYDLMDTLLSDYLCEHVDYILHAPAVSAWIHGRRPVSAEIVGFYRRPGGADKLARVIYDQILPHIPDRAVAVEQIIALVRKDSTIHPETKAELLMDTENPSLLCARVLIYAMARHTNYIAADLQDAA